MRQVVHIGLNQALEFEHHARTALWVGHRPGWLCRQCRLHRTFKYICVTQGHARLNAAIIRVHNIAKTRRACAGATADEMIDVTHISSPDSVRVPCAYHYIIATMAYYSSKIAASAYMD